MTSLNGSVNENRTRFTGCRQYSGESRLIYDDPAPDSSASAAEPARTLIAPPKLMLDLALHTPIVFREAAVGDPVTAVLAKALRLPDGTSIPKGALIHGRIASLRESLFGRYTGYAVGLKFFELESGNTRVKFSATLEGVLTAQPGIRTRSSFGPAGSSGSRTKTCWAACFSSSRTFSGSNADCA